MIYNEIIHNLIVVVGRAGAAATSTAQTTFPRCHTAKCLKVELGFWSKMPQFKSV